VPEIDKMIMESISEETPADLHVHSDPYDEQPFEEEDVEIEIGTNVVPEDDSPTLIHFAIEESADMRFFARSNSMPLVSSLPPLEMTSFLASQATPYSPRSHYLTEGLDLAASSRTPVLSTFDDAMALVRPSTANGWSTSIPMPKPYDPQTIITQSHYASSPLTPMHIDSRDTRPPSEMSSTNWEFVGLGQATAYRTHSSLQRAHSVPQSPFPTQHFGSIPHVTGPVSVIGDFGTTSGTEFPAPSPYAVETVVTNGVLLRHDGFVASTAGLPSHRVSPDVDVDMSGLLNNEMEEDENGVRQVTVVNVQPDKPNPTPAFTISSSIAVPLSITKGSEGEIDTACHHLADISHTLFAFNTLGKPEDMALVDIFPQLGRAIEILLVAVTCASCATVPVAALAQLALLSRICDILRYPHPITPSPLPLIVAGGRITMTGLAPEMEVHIVDVIWANWRGSSVQKVCALMKKEARDMLGRIAEEEIKQRAQTEEADKSGREDEEFMVEGTLPNCAQSPESKGQQYIVRELNGVIFHEPVKDSTETAQPISKAGPERSRAKFIVDAIEILSRIPSK
jgi:hypothetical protein